MDTTTDAEQADPLRNPQSAEGAEGNRGGWWAGEPIRNSLEWLPLVLQTSDPLFPTGAYAHSLGLEEIVRLGLVRDEETLSRFLRDQIIPALAHLELPYLRFLRAVALAGDVDELCALDDEIDAWKICRELREASVQFGTRRLRILSQIASSDVLASFEARRPATHHLTVYGIQMIATPLDAALATYFYHSLSGFCGGSLKLIRIGQEGCQRVLREACQRADETLARSLKVEREQAGWFSPLIEIASMRHERAAERLFIS